MVKVNFKTIVNDTNIFTDYTLLITVKHINNNFDLKLSWQ